MHSTQRAGAGVAPCAGTENKSSEEEGQGGEQRSTESKLRASELVQFLNHLQLHQPTEVRHIALIFAFLVL